MFSPKRVGIVFFGLCVTLSGVRATLASAQEQPPGNPPPLAPASPAARLPVPAASEIAARRELVREVFRAEYEAKGPSSRVELAERLMTEAEGEPQASTRYVLLIEAIDLAVEGLDVDAPLAAIAAIAREFEVDELALTEQALVKLSGGRPSREDAGKILDAWHGVIDRGVDRDQYDLAKRCVESALAFSRRSRDGEAEKAVASRAERIEQLRRAYLDLGPALIRLRGDAEDASASLAVGTFYSMLKEDWSRGLAHLAKCSDADLAMAARVELGADPGDGRAVAAIADAWWELAEASGERALMSERAGALRRHAAALYRLALPKLSGLFRTRVERRLEEIDPEDASAETGGMPELQVFLFTRGRRGRPAWTPHPLDRMPTTVKNDVLLARNTTGVFQEALLGTVAEYRGDLVAKLSVAGATRVGLVSERHGWSYAELRGAGWHEVVLERSDGRLTITVNGREVPVMAGRHGDRTSGHIFVAVESKKQCGIRKLEVEDRFTGRSRRER